MSFLESDVASRDALISVSRRSFCTPKPVSVSAVGEGGEVNIRVGQFRLETLRMPVWCVSKMQMLGPWCAWRQAAQSRASSALSLLQTPLRLVMCLSEIIFQY